MSPAEAPRARDGAEGDRGVQPGRGSPKPTQTIPFDAFRRAAPRLRDIVDRFTAFLEAQEVALGLRGDRARTHDERNAFRLSVEATLCNLAAAWLLGPCISLTLVRSPSLFPKGQYASPVYGKHFPRLLETMEQLGLIEAPRGYRVSEDRRALSTIRPLPVLAEYLPLNDISWDDLSDDPSRPLIVLKAPKAKGTGDTYLPFHETRRSKQMARAVALVNDGLRAAQVDLLATRTSDGSVIDPSRRALHRIFNDGHWRRGGRLSPGFWTNMPKTERCRLIRLGGEPIAHVDYSELFPTLAYARAQAERPPDIYDIEGNGLHRRGWKRLLNALLCARSTLKNWPDDGAIRLAFGDRPPTFREAVGAITLRHAPIARLFGTGIGMEFMWIESEMMMDVLTDLHRQAIPALPIYDAVAVPRSKTEEAKEAMTEAMKLRLGDVRVQISVEEC